MECPVTKSKNVKGFIDRNIHASKGDAGKLLIIGGSERYVGAAVLAGLGALRAGVDSIIIAAPEDSARLMNAFSPDLITWKLPGSDLSNDHLEILKKLAETASVVLIGPGLGVSKQREEWLAKLLPLISTPKVLDADATKQVSLRILEETILFANKREYEYLKEFNSFTDELVAPALGSNILVVKGQEDVIVTSDGRCKVDGGHARATVAGTGDVLSGIAAAFYTQSKNAQKSAVAACMVAKRCAEHLAKEMEYGFIASDMVKLIPKVTKELRLFRETKYALLRPAGDD